MTTSNFESSQQSKNQFDNNYDILRQSELGIILADAYEMAVEIDPRMAEICIKEITDPEEKRHGYATPSWSSESGTHEISVRLENLDETLMHYEDAMDQSPDAIRIICERMGIDPRHATPQLMYVQSILHEMGHITEYMDYEDNPGDLRVRQKQEKLALPIGNATAGQLMQLDSNARKLVDANWADVRALTGVDSIEELIAIQSVAYRGMTSETVADNFASDVFLYNPQMYHQLTQEGVDPYRNYFVAT